MSKHLSLLSAAVILATTSSTLGLPAKAEETYNASCKAFGDAITLTSTGEIVLEQRLVKFKPFQVENAPSGQRGVCVIKQDPPGYKWIPCWKKDGRFASGNWDYPRYIRPTEAIANSVQYRGWTGACKVKL